MIPSRPPHSLWLLLLAAWNAIILPITGVSGTTTITVWEPSPTEDATSAQYTSDHIFRDTLLNETNYYRAQHDAHGLTWNETLQAYAQDWADRCLWKHSVRRPPVFLSPLHYMPASPQNIFIYISG